MDVESQSESTAGGSLFLRNARLFDAPEEVFRSVDIEIRNGTVSRVMPTGESISSPSVEMRGIDVAGSLILPGLIDFHSHVYWGGTPLGIDPDKLGPVSGVTLFHDFGSAGAGNIEGFVYHVIRRSSVRIRCALNLSFVGLTPIGNTARRIGELADPKMVDIRAAVEACEMYRSYITGIKVRLGPGTSGDYGNQALEQALFVAEECELPLFVHATDPPPLLRRVFSSLRPGDVFTHCFNPNRFMSILDSEGSVRTAVVEALARGVILDVGHGVSNFTFAVADRSIAAGVVPGFVSSDVHAYNIAGPVFDLPTTIAKLVSVGVPLERVLSKATIAPARYLGVDHELGSLEPGKVADFCIASWEPEAQELQDSAGVSRRTGRLSIQNTFINGREISAVHNDRSEAKYK